jgi:glycosyltransferase involved in cell wall biosynthesis
MRITFILPTVSLSGGNKVIAIYAQKLRQNGHSVKLVSPPPRSASLRARIRSLRKGNGWPVDPERYPSQFDGAGLDHKILDRWRPVRDGDVPDADVIIATWWETAEWVNALGPAKGAKVYFIQGHEVFPYLPVERSQATYRLPLHKIVVSRWLQQLMKLEYRDPIVDLVPNSVDHTQFFASIRDKQAFPTVGFLHSNGTTKGTDVLVAALEAVQEKTANLRFVSFGSELPAASPVLPEGTWFQFRPPQHQIRNIYAQCDVWVTASKSEGFNLPAMEAMSCRTPVVATRTGWPEEAVKSGWNGVLVDVDDVTALADAIGWVLSQTNDAWRTLSSNAFETVAESSWDASAAMFEKALDNARARASCGEIGGGAFSAGQEGS